MNVKQFINSISIFSKVLLGFMLITIVLLIIGGTITHQILSASFSANIESLISYQLKYKAELIKSDINQHFSDVKMIAKNSFIANGLLDSTGRELYLIPFLNQYSFKIKENVDVLLTDFEGKPIASKGSASIILSAKEIDSIKYTLSSKKRTVLIYLTDSHHRLVIMEPVIFPPTQSVEGVILARFNLSSFLNTYLTTGSNVEEYRLYSKQRLLFSSLGKEGLTRDIFAHKRIPINIPATDIGLVLELRHDDSLINAALRQVNFWFFIVCSTMLIITYFLTQILVKPITTPLIELSRSVQKISEGQWQVPLHHGASSTKEIRTLYNAFSDMSKAVHSANQKLKSRVAERTAQLKLSKEELKLASIVFQNITDGIFIIDQEGIILSINPSFQRMCGNTSTELIGHSWKILSFDTNINAQTNIWSELNSHKTWQGEVKISNEGNGLTTLVTANSVKLSESGLESYVFIFKDITERKKSEEQADFIAHHDSLTGLPNRLLMIDRIEQLITQAHRTNLWFSLIFMDLDRFKHINDSAGHIIGDELLIQVSRRLQIPLRKEDTIVRLGGDEFVILCPHLNRLEDSAAIPLKIIEQFKAPFIIGEHVLFSSTSIGVAIFPNDGLSCEQLLKHADMAMYEAKRSGGNSYKFFNHKMHKKIERHIYIESHLRRALNQEQFELYFQPKFNMESRALCGFEALIRLKADGKYIPPEEFIPIAEEVGIIVDIGNWVAIQGIKACKEINSLGYGYFTMAINVSIKQLFQEKFSDTISSCLQDENLSAQCLEIELTESILASQTDALVENIKQFNDMGICLTIDDFGTGFSCMAYLKTFPVGCLKIDRSFVTDILTELNDAEISKSLILMAHSMNMKVIAEGVENEDVFEYLKNNGCDEAQGYLLGMPLNLEETISFLNNSNLQRQLSASISR